MAEVNAKVASKPLVSTALNVCFATSAGCDGVSAPDFLYGLSAPDLMPIIIVGMVSELIRGRCAPVCCAEVCAPDFVEVPRLCPDFASGLSFVS